MGESKYRRSFRASSPSHRLSISALTSSQPPPHASPPLSSDRPDATRISSLLQSTTITTPRAYFLRMNSTTVQSIRSVPSSNFIVLFTPAILPGSSCPPGTSSRQSGSPYDHPPSPAYTHGRRITGLPMDPFEPLGRALALRHKRVRHVPFVPGSRGAGMGAIHSTFLESARGVIVVLCEPLNDSDTGLSPMAASPSFLPRHTPSHTSTDAQAEFTNAIWQHSYWSATPDETPLVLVIVSSSRERAEVLVRSCGLQRFDTIIYAENYEAGTLDEIAKTVFGS
jgi:hypothetical protein